MYKGELPQLLFLNNGLLHHFSNLSTKKKHTHTNSNHDRGQSDRVQGTEYNYFGKIRSG